MNNRVKFFIQLAISFLPFILFVFLNSKANVQKEKRNRQYPMPVVAVIYCVLLAIFFNRLSTIYVDGFLRLIDLLEESNIGLNSILNSLAVSERTSDLAGAYSNLIVYLKLVLFNTVGLLVYVIIKRVLTLILAKVKVPRDTFISSIVEVFYYYDETNDNWYIKEHYGQARTFMKTAYYGCCFVSGLALLISCDLCLKNLVVAPFYPVFALIIIGEIAFFIDGLNVEDCKSNLNMQSDNSRHMAMYALLRKPLRNLFGDKLSTEGTTVNNGGTVGGAIEDVLMGIEREGGHIGKNYAMFIRRKMDMGLKPNVDYIRCGYDLSVGKSLLFNTPFYDKLNPYVFYAMNRKLLTGGKVLIVLGRHGIEEDLQQWISSGMKAVSNVPDLWEISVLSDKKMNEDNLPDIGIIPHSGVHDLNIHKNILPFLRKVSFVMIIEPSRLVTTAQVGLNLLIKCCGQEKQITFCSVDRNCDGLVDALSHILMTNITEVSATEYPHGMSSYMYWTADDDYTQHRIMTGITRYLGMGTELSMVALKNQVEKTIWYGGEKYPVKDAHWIAKQYYYDLLDYAGLPTNQETFDKCFKASFNMCDERVSDYSFITVEDDRNNLFETRRNYATIAEKQGFVNVISSEYMLREYMSANPELFMADAKAIPYIIADYARTKRNAILSLCLLMCVDLVKQELLQRQMDMLNISTNDPVSEIWKEVCAVFGGESASNGTETQILSVKTHDGKIVQFEKDYTILFKRMYNGETGKFESAYVIENEDFAHIILDDLQNASYIAEQESKDFYIGTELKGHVYQKYMPGQLFTLNGKYYEMVSTTTDNRILVRRASEHIDGRLAYRQVRNYIIHHLKNSETMGALKSINDIGVHYQLADFSVDTPGYWKLHAYNDFDNGVLVNVNGVPTRNYHHKHILKLDFSKFGDAFTDSVRMTLTNLLNEAFVTLFADNQAFISAVTAGKYDAPLTYSLELEEDAENSEKCIFIIEDSQLDIGLLIAVERNISRILQIISDYLTWNDEQIEESIRKQNEPEKERISDKFDVYEKESQSEEKKGLFAKIKNWFKTLIEKIKGLFKKKGKIEQGEPEDGMTPKQKKKAEREAEKAAKKAEREARKAQKQEEKLRKKQERAAKKMTEIAEKPAVDEADNTATDDDESINVGTDSKIVAESENKTDNEKGTVEIESSEVSANAATETAINDTELSKIQTNGQSETAEEGNEGEGNENA